MIDTFLSKNELRKQLDQANTTIDKLCENLLESADLINEAENQIYDSPKLERDLQECSEKYRAIVKEAIGE